MESEATVADSGRQGQTAPGPCSSALRAGGELELEAIARGAEASAVDPEPQKVGGELDSETRTPGGAEASWIHCGVRKRN
jgi:hypothetical protein